MIMMAVMMAILMATKHHRDSSVRDKKEDPLSSSSSEYANIQDNSGKMMPSPSRRRRKTIFGWLEDPDGEKYLRGSVMEIKKQKSIDSAIQFHRRLALLDTFNLINEHKLLVRSK